MTERQEKFTPGPWITVPYSYGVECNDGLNVCDCDVIGYSPERKRANSHLIAAAPDMYELLKNITLDARYCDMDKVVEVLKKARGEE